MTVAPADRAVRVLIADDHPLIVEGLTNALARFGMEVVGQALTTADVLPKFEQLEPDVVVLDVRFGEAKTGLDAARELLQRHAGARIVFYSQFDQEEIVQEAYRLGGNGFVTKNKPVDVLAEAIREVSEDKTHFMPEIAARLALLGVRRDESPQTKLDARELQVFKLMAQGSTNPEIAAAMGLSLKTISTTSQSIKDKLGVVRPAEITRLAVKHQVIEL